MTITGPDGLQHQRPSLPAAAMKTWQIIRPRERSSCQAAGCRAYQNGWRTVVDADKAEMVRHLTGYQFTEARLPEGLYEFTFPAGQECFLGRAGQHSRPLDDRSRLIERGGDWRGNPTGMFREHTRADDWVDSFANHQDRLADRFGRG